MQIVQLVVIFVENSKFVRRVIDCFFEMVVVVVAENGNNRLTLTELKMLSAKTLN